MVDIIKKRGYCKNKLENGDEEEMNKVELLGRRTRVPLSPSDGGADDERCEGEWHEVNAGGEGI